MKKLNKKKLFILILVVLIVILTITFSILYRNNIYVQTFFDKYIFRKNVTENNLPKISIENNHVFAFNDNIIYLEKNTLKFYDKSANEITSLELQISNPIFISSGKFLCIAEKNGSKIYLISGKDIVWQKDIEGNISNLSINKNGYVAVSISDTTYTTICKLYNDSGSELFTTYFANSYIIDLSISNDNKFLALAEANFSGIAIQSNIKILSIDEALSNSTDAIQYNYSAQIDSLIINLEYCDAYLVCLYDNHIDIIKDTSVSEVTNFENSNILFADINNKIIQVEKYNDNIFSSKFELQFLEAETLEKTIFTLDKEPKSIETFGNITSVNFGTEVFFINNSGWLLKDYTSSQEIQSIVISNNIAGIVYKDKVEILDL